jgi:hypothetical protein
MIIDVVKGRELTSWNKFCLPCGLAFCFWGEFISALGLDSMRIDSLFGRVFGFVGRNENYT